MSTADYDRFQTELEFASILGMPFMGTGNDPTSANNRNIEPWTIAGEKWEALNTLSLDWGIHLYPHNHSPAYNFLQDGPMVTVTEDRVTGRRSLPMVRGESGKRLMQHYLDVTRRTCASSRWTSTGPTSRSTSGGGATTGRATGSRTSSTRSSRSRTSRSGTRCTTPRTATGRPSRRASATATRWSRSATTSDIDFETFFRTGGAGLPQPELRAGQRPGRLADPAGRCASRSSARSA